MIASYGYINYIYLEWMKISVLGTAAEQVAMVWACVAKRRQWVKKCVEYELEGSRPRDRPKRTWREVVSKRLQHIN